MSRLRRIEIMEPYCPPSLLFRETSIFTPKTLGFCSIFEEEYDLSFGLDVLNPSPSPFELFVDFCDYRTPSFCSYKTFHQRIGTELYLESLCDRVGKLESRFDRLISARKIKSEDRKYSWTAEIKSPDKYGFDRKYKWTKEIKEGGEKKGSKWTAEIKGKGEGNGAVRKYTIEVESGGSGDSGTKSEKKKNKKKDKNVVEIEESSGLGHGAVVLRQAFAKRAGATAIAKGKKKEMTVQDAAMMIQMSFRAYLIRRSQALRAFRELAIAKAKLKELRALFNNFSYRRRIGHDAEERQRFTEKIIVVLLSVDAIEGADLMVRASKRSMVDELEAMLDAVDPQPAGRSLSMRRRTFDMPDSIIQKELAASVSQVVQMLNREENSSETFEACL